MKRFFRKGDIIIIVCAAVLCALLFFLKSFSDGGSLVAQIYEDGEITHEIDLSLVGESYEIEINGAVILVENGAVSYIEAQCPDKTCIRSGVLRRAGDTAACVPGRTVVTVTSHKTDKNIDIITY